MRSWGVYIKLLIEHGAKEQVTSLLTHLKDAYRNPVLHPEENYNEERVLVLFGICVSAVVMMAQEIDSITVKAAFLQFPNEAMELGE
jgi:hypothetical protein